MINHPPPAPKPPAPPPPISAVQAVANEIIAQIPLLSTAKSLGALIGYSSEWVRVRLILLFKDQPGKVGMVGRNRHIPQATAIEFVLRIYNLPVL